MNKSNKKTPIFIQRYLNNIFSKITYDFEITYERGSKNFTVEMANLVLPVSIFDLRIEVLNGFSPKKVVLKSHRIKDIIKSLSVCKKKDGVFLFEGVLNI